MLMRMNLRGRTLALVLAGAVVLASGAYALGSQVGGGSATANDDQDHPKPAFLMHGNVSSGVDRLADKLGVSEEELQEAFEDVAPKPPDRPRLRRHFQKGGPGPGIAFGMIGPGGDFAAELAKELGVDESKIKDALENIRKKHEAEAKQKHDELAQKLADKLGISVDKVKEALAEGPIGVPMPRP
jgi:hypothetical protein